MIFACFAWLFVWVSQGKVWLLPFEICGLLYVLLSFIYRCIFFSLSRQYYFLSLQFLWDVWLWASPLSWPLLWAIPFCWTAPTIAPVDLSELLGMKSRIPLNLHSEMAAFALFLFFWTMCPLKILGGTTRATLKIQMILTPWQKYSSLFPCSFKVREHR